MRAVVSDMRATGRIQDLRAPVVSPGRHDVLIQFAMKGNPDTADQRVQPVLTAVARARAAYPGVTIEQFGQASANKWFKDTIFKDMKRAEWTAVPLALGILLVVFGALVAATLPVVLALTAFFAANGLLALISHAMHVDQSASSVMLLMGLAVGVDYCLFYLRREREERAAGQDPQASLRIAAATSGRSVLISGLTVIVAMAGMFLSGMQLFAGFAVATISVVLIAVAGSVTVLPALMSLLGDKVELGRIPFLGQARRPAGGGRIWNTVLRGVLAPARAVRRPLRRVPPRPGVTRARPAHRDPQRAADPPVQHSPGPGLRRHHDRVPRRPGSRRRRGQGARHPGPPGPAGDRRVRAGGPAQRGGWLADPGDRVPPAPTWRRSRFRWPAAGPTPRPGTRWPPCTTRWYRPRWAGFPAARPWSAATWPHPSTSPASSGTGSSRSSCSSWASRSS